MEELVFTPSSILSLLLQIEELSDYNINLTETLDGKLQLTVGDSIYILEDDVNKVTAPLSVVEQVEQINVENYEMMENDEQISIDTPISGGIISELSKSLLLGGVIRLGTKLLK